MKKYLLYALAALSTLCTLTFAACSSGGGGGGTQSGVNTKLIGKWEVVEPNVFGFESVEFSADGFCILVIRSSEDQFSALPFFGTYKAVGDDVAMYSYGTESVFATLAVKSLEGGYFDFDIESENELLPGGMEFRAIKVADLVGSAKTDLLCRTWELAGNEGDDPYGMLELGDLVYFSKAGTYIHVWNDGQASLSSWQWKSEEEGTVYHSWLNPPVWNDDETFTVEELSKTGLTLYRVFGGTSHSSRADGDYWVRSDYTPATAPDHGGGGDGGDGNGKTLTYVAWDKYSDIKIAGTGPASIDWGDGSEPWNFTLTPAIEGDRFSAYYHEHRKTYIDGKEKHTVTIKGSNITHLEVHSGVASIDLSEIKTLVWLNIGCAPNMTELDVTGNTELRYLAALSARNEDFRCNIESLDLSNNPKLTQLVCSYLGLPAIDLSNNPLLESVKLTHNRLTSLDMSAQPALRILAIQSNQLSADALNAVFYTLSTIKSDKTVWIHNNPGKSSCNKEIAEDRGWKVNTFQEHSS